VRRINLSAQSLCFRCIRGLRCVGLTSCTNAGINRLRDDRSECFPNWHFHTLAYRFLMNCLCLPYEIFVASGIQ